MKNEKHEDCKCAGNSIVRSKGEYTILVNRSGFDTLKDLPYPIWGTLYMQSNSFAVAIKDYLPDGITCVSSVVDGNIILDYSDGAGNTDTITVFAPKSALLSYPEMLTGLNTAYLKTELCYFCNNSPILSNPLLSDGQNKTLQSKPLYLAKIGGLGSKGNELVIPASRLLPNNSVKDIIEISMRKQDIMPDNVWIHTFAYINMTGKSQLRFYWQIIINEIVNMNKTAFDI